MEGQRSALGTLPAHLIAAEQLRDWALSELPTFDLAWSRQLVRAMDAVSPEGASDE